MHSILWPKSNHGCEPVSVTFDRRMIGFYPMATAPIDGLIRLFKEVEQEPGILSVSLVHGFPRADRRPLGSDI